jgi:haloalkane dehalogenase
MDASRITPVDPYVRERVAVLDTEMSYVDTGEGDPVVFLHGNPTSSYLWRNVIPHVESHARCLAPDLVGMGDSGKSPAGSYRFADHARYLDAWFEAVVPSENVTLVVHDWGSALGFDWARRHPERVRGIAYMEAIVRPFPSWEEWPKQARGVFREMRSDRGEELVLKKNAFVEGILPESVLRPLTEAEMEAYRRPYPTPESRRPTLSWPREMPIDGEPADVVETVDAYSKWLAQNRVPKLFVNAEPGVILTGSQRDFCRGFKNQEEVTVRGSHFLQEDSPHEIGEAVARFLRGLDLVGSLVTTPAHR